MTYEEAEVEKCIKTLLKEMRNVDLEKNKEYRISKNKTDKWKIHLCRLYWKGFKQGVYCAR